MIKGEDKIAPEANERLARYISQFRYDAYGFVMAAYPWGQPGTALAHKDGPEAWQAELLHAVSAHRIENAHRKAMGLDYVPWRSAVASGHGVGKAHAYDDVTPTPFGPMRWGDLDVGDFVFRGDGAATVITATTHYKQVPMYRVTFDDRSYAEVSSGHLWNVRGRNERRTKKAGWLTLETIDILKRGVKRPNGAAETRQWEIPIQGAAQFAPQRTALHPYLVGVWIGDGAKGTPRYSKPHDEVANKIRTLGYIVVDGDRDVRYVRGISHHFKDGVFARGSHERFIPDEYKYNSIENRMAMFSGLCDTDGEVHGSGSIGYSTTSHQLALDVVWLARSLGCKAILQETTKKGWYRDGDGERVECRDCYRVTINAPFNPFTIKHRKDAYKPSEARYLSRWIESIEPIGKADGMCITVAAEDGLYLANDFIVTHNSALVAWIIDWIMSTTRDARGVVTANTGNQLQTKTWPELAKWHQMLITRHWFQWTAQSYYFAAYPEDQQKNYKIDAITVSPENSEAFAGLHNEASAVVIIMDEASGIERAIWEVAEGALTDGEPFMFCFGNPTQPTGPFAECFIPNETIKWWTKHVDSREVSHTNKAHLNALVARWGEDSDFVRIRVRGRFPEKAYDGYISPNKVIEAQQRPVYHDDGVALIMGVDIARFGNDDTVFAFRQGTDCKSIPWFTMKGADNVQVATKAAELIEKYRPDAVVIENVGPGVGVIDILRSWKHKVLEVHPGAPSSMPMSYVNVRAELWGKGREWIDTRGCLPEDGDLFKQLTAIRYTLKKGETALQMESKADMKDRGLESPDRADAFMLTFAYNISRRDNRRNTNNGAGGLRTVAKHEYDPLSV